jgi:digeranylgeranylglycerophospholipid reductase
MSLDVLVIGGGPAGLYAAWRLAQAGFSTLVCEEHATIGTPVHCTGVLSAASFDEFPIPREAILNPLTTVQFVSPAGFEVRYTPPTLQAVVIDRARFDQRLAAQARAAGADIRCDTRVSSLEVTRDEVLANVGGLPVRARLAVLASGASYTLQRRLGLGLPRAYLQTAQRELPARSLGDVVIQFGSAVAPGGFAWAVPIERPEGPHVRVGVMATGNTNSWYDAMVGRLASWGVHSEGARPRLKFLPLRTISRTFGDRLLVVGDAAGLVKPTTGGGIHYSIVSSSLACDVAESALRRDRLEAGALSVYQSRWRRRLAGEFQAQWALRRLAEHMSDRQIDALFELTLSDGVMPIVQRTANFNHHRHLISALLRHGPARQIFWPART